LIGKINMGCGMALNGMFPAAYGINDLKRIFIFEKNRKKSGNKFGAGEKGAIFAAAFRESDAH
jgi:hypothetical protein